MKPPLPFVPGSEYAGVVQAVGAGKGPDVFYDPVGEPLV
jgi:NADPH:quinone reductase-like Zn-dependent oxidoreductase